MSEMKTPAPLEAEGYPQPAIITEIEMQALISSAYEANRAVDRRMRIWGKILKDRGYDEQCGIEIVDPDEGTIRIHRKANGGA